MGAWIFLRTYDRVLLDPPFIVSLGDDEADARRNASNLLAQGQALESGWPLPHGVGARWQVALSAWGDGRAVAVGLDSSPLERA